MYPIFSFRLENSNIERVFTYLARIVSARLTITDTLSAASNLTMNFPPHMMFVSYRVIKLGFGGNNAPDTCPAMLLTREDVSPNLCE